MKFSALTKIFIFSFIIFMFSCEDDEIKIPEIPSEFTTYVDRFVAEAKLRGRTIYVNNLEVKFESMEDYCGLGSFDPPRVSFDQTCWNNLPDIAKEILMLHELGHAILQRGHDSRVLQNGDYASIMYSDPYYLYNEYTPEKRTYYLDELFEVLNGLPGWTSAKVNESTVFSDDISIPSAWVYKITDGANHIGNVVDTTFSSTPISLAIHSNESSTGFSTWSYSFDPTNIEVGSELLLKVKIKTAGLTGGGAFFVFRADAKEKDYPIFFYSTQDRPVLGTAEFGETEYSIKVNYFPESVDKLNIFLILDGASTGTVFFDDIQLLMYQ